MRKALNLTLLLIAAFLSKVNAQEYHLGQIIDNPDGSRGVVFYLNEDGTDGWMVALHDASTYCPWGPTGHINGLDNIIVNNDYLTTLFQDQDGYGHTQKIREHCESIGYTGQYAAGMVDFENGWYLPSAGQLKWLYVNAIFYEPTLQSVGEKMGLNAYWSSSVENDGKAWIVHFGAPYPMNNWAWNGHFKSMDKGSYYDNYDRNFAVRAIRNLDYSPLPYIGQLQTPAVICGEGSIELVTPNLHNSTSFGWQIAQDEAFTNPIDYIGQVLNANYNGWYLRLWATNQEGTTYSNIVRISVHESSESYTTASSCEPYNWNGQTYNESGVYTITLFNHWGCDSIATLILNVGQDYVTRLPVNTCDSYTWNNTTYTDTGLYEQSFTSMQGCDSIVILDLTIKSSSYVSQIQGESMIYYKTNGLYTYSLDPVEGCFGYEWSIDNGWDIDYDPNAPQCMVNINSPETATLKVRVYTECGVVERDLHIIHDARPDVVIYPNPTEGDFNIVLNGMKGEAVIVIYNNIGQFLGRYNVDTSPEGVVVPYSLIGHAAGLYFITVTNDYQTITKQVVKATAATHGLYYWVW